MLIYVYCNIVSCLKGFKRHSVACKGSNSTNRKVSDKNENTLSNENIKKLTDSTEIKNTVVTTSEKNNRISVQNNTQVEDFEMVKQTESNMTVDKNENAGMKWNVYFYCIC